MATARNSCLVIAAMGRPFEYLVEYLEYLDIPRCVSTTTLLCVVEQHLIARVCPNCLITYAPKPSELRELKIRCDNARELRFAKSSGCTTCRGTGRLGVVGVHEISTMTDALREMLRKQEPSDAIRKHVLDSGISTFHESAVQKLVTRQIASTTVIQYCLPSWRNRMAWIDIDSATGLRRR